MKKLKAHHLKDNWDDALKLIDVPDATIERLIGFGKVYRHIFNEKRDIPEGRLLHYALIGIAAIKDRRAGTRCTGRLIDLIGLPKDGAP